MQNVNITGFRLVDPTSQVARHYLKKFPSRHSPFFFFSIFFYISASQTQRPWPPVVLVKCSHLRCRSSSCEGFERPRQYGGDFYPMRNKRKMIEGQESQIKKARQVDHDDCDDCNDCRTCNSSHWIATLWQRRGWGAGLVSFFRGWGAVRPEN